MRAVIVVMLACVAGHAQGPIGSPGWWASLPLLAIAGWIAAGLEMDAERWRKAQESEHGS